MVFYFSATGNCRYIAARLAGASGEAALFIPQLVREGRTSFAAKEGERIGFVLPTYFWGLPALAEDFLRRLTLTAPQGAYIYFVAAYGVTPGASAAFMRELLASKGLRLSACCGVQTPDTWTPIFDLSDKAAVAQKNAAAEPQIDRAAAMVQGREAGDFLRRKIPLWLCRAFARPLYQRQRVTKPFAVSSACIGCGACAAQCPVGAIEMCGGRPVWVRQKCEICLGCLHGCPRFAISYGARTAAHGQYRNPHI